GPCRHPGRCAEGDLPPPRGAHTRAPPFTGGGSRPPGPGRRRRAPALLPAGAGGPGRGRTPAAGRAARHRSAGQGGAGARGRDGGRRGGGAPMTTGLTPTGRPRQRLPLLPRLTSAALAAGLTLEFARYMTTDRMLSRLPVFSRGAYQLADWYEPHRAWVLDHLVLVAAGTVLGLVLLLVLYRQWLLFWNNNVVARLSGLRASPEDLSFPVRPVDVVAEIRRRPPGTYFVGLTPRRGWLGWRWKPAYLSQTQKTMHRHVLGKTGSGKTLSVLWPRVLQDVLDGKGCLVMDAKGSDENVRTMKGIAAVAGRQHQLRVLSLPAWNRPQLFTHRYNLVYIRPRTPTDPGGDPAATAERVFDCLPLGDNEYYNTQAQVMF